MRKETTNAKRGALEQSGRKKTHHFDSDSAVALARFCVHVAPTLANISHPNSLGGLLRVSESHVSNSNLQGI